MQRGYAVKYAIGGMRRCYGAQGVLTSVAQREATDAPSADYVACVEAHGKRGKSQRRCNEGGRSRLGRGVIPRLEHLTESQRSGLNRRPPDYESGALPLSYAGDRLKHALARTRTVTPCGTTPSRWRVYQFHHQGESIDD